MGLRDRFNANRETAQRERMEADLAQCRRQLRRLERWYDDDEEMIPDDQLQHDLMSAEERYMSTRLGRPSREDWR